MDLLWGHLWCFCLGTAQFGNHYYSVGSLRHLRSIKEKVLEISNCVGRANDHIQCVNKRRDLPTSYIFHLLAVSTVNIYNCWLLKDEVT